jgi:alkylated DNA repair dioxygenase AlkB
MDIFGPTGSEPVRIPLVDGDATYYSTIDLPASPNDLLWELIHNTPWRAEDVMVWGKRFSQPRLTAWYGSPGRVYTYSGIRMDPSPWTPRLLALRQAVRSAAGGPEFNSVLLNYYRNERDSMGFHSDDEPELGPRPVIASLSLGEERVLVFKSRKNAALRPVRLKLGSGSLLMMAGDTQRNWKHGIEKQKRALGPRVNLTFRVMV